MSSARISNGAAAVLSLVFPGLGQICQGRTMQGIMAFVMVPLFMLVIFSFALAGSRFSIFFIFLLPLPHLFQVIDTARYNPDAKKAKVPAVAPANAKLEAAKQRWLSEREAENEVNH